MKQIYKPILLLCIALGTIPTYAQNKNDSTLNRQVMLEREYAPTLQEASRINETPTLVEHPVKTSIPKFINQAPILALSNSRVGQVAPGDIGTNILRKKKRGYLLGAGGTKSNFDAALGYRLIDTEKDRLNIFGTFENSGGKVDYVNKNYAINKVKTKYMNIDANVNYQHTFTPSILSINAGFKNMGYNYYGNSYIFENEISDITDIPFDYDTKQSTNVMTFGAGLKSRSENKGFLNYDGSIGYTYFKNKHGFLPDEDGMKGGIIRADIDVNKELNSDAYLGGRLYFMNQSFSNKENNLKDTLLHSFNNLALNPYFSFEGLNWNVELGVNANMLFDVKTKFFISPNIKAQLILSDKNTLYANITGGVNENNFLDVLAENRYAYPLSRVKYSKTQFDAELGFKSSVLPGLEFDIFGGYKSTKDDHLFIASSLLADRSAFANSKWSNVSIPAYAEVSTGKFGLMGKTNLIPLTTFTARFTAYFYNVKKLELPLGDVDMSPSKKAWGKPGFTIEANAVIKPIEPLSIIIDYYLAAERKAYVRGITMDMKEINELNAKIEFQLTDWFSMNVKAHNILNRKHEIVKGYTLQTMSIMGGFGFKF